ncbi:MAG: SMP-30/gluconolactonase/LRE family protein [Planctomycetaceae bacterium]|nr:SMP-30/gluconolactonase/LRE family protein [Planctomycetaceae bacterium]
MRKYDAGRWGKFGLFFVLLVVGLTGASPLQAQRSVWQRGATLEKLYAGAAGEGPAWHPKIGLVASHGSVYLMRDGEDPQIYKKDLGTNGLMWDADGRLWCCQPSKNRVIRLEADATETVVTDKFEGAPYNQPNDITIDVAGRIYFSDPKYGPHEDLPQQDDKGRPVEGVYRVDLDGTVTRVITHEVDRPNGVLITRDQKYLYVAGNNNSVKGGERKLFRFEVMDCCGTVLLETKTLVYDWGSSRGPDGMAEDVKGNIYVAGGLNSDDVAVEDNSQKGGIYVFSPNGKLIDFIAVKVDEVTNCAFGGKDLKTLYITAGGTLFSMQTKNRGVITAGL